MWYISSVRAIPFLQSFLILVLASLIIFGLDSAKFLSLPKTAAYFFTNPISFGLHRTSQNIGRQFYFIFAARFAAQENKALKEQLGQLTTENAEIRRKLSETEIQIEQGQKLDPKTYKLIASRPIGVDRYLKIDKGINDGIKVGQPAVYKDNLVGRVVQSSEKGSSIMLTKDPDSKVAAFSIGKNGKAKGVLVGEFGSELLFDKILHEEEIEIGDLVYSEGTEGYLPRGLVLGIVSEVINEEHEVFKKAKVKELFEVEDFDLVFVIQE